MKSLWDRKSKGVILKGWAAIIFIIIVIIATITGEVSPEYLLYIIIGAVVLTVISSLFKKDS